MLRQLRELVTTYQSVGQVEGAVYWADKVASLSTETEDVNILGQALVTDKHRAATNAMRNNLSKSYMGQQRSDSVTMNDKSFHIFQVL